MGVSTVLLAGRGARDHGARFLQARGRAGDPLRRAGDIGRERASRPTARCSTADWARFLAEYSFLIGLSIDGPARLHDHYRKDADGKGTHRRVMDAAKMLTDNGVEFNILALINDLNVKEPEAVWEFLKKNEFAFLQFVPCVEPGGKGEPASFSITPRGLRRVPREDVRPVGGGLPGHSVRDFDDLLAREVGMTAGTCTVSERCGELRRDRAQRRRLRVRLLRRCPSGGSAT